ncbi:MAG: integrase [Candidatus Puniceispirillum sp.]|nr:integrase [Candidatus Pelagibacter sp.]MBA4283397.1 integrase [Candidatus Puniceispirillum sp.]
MTEKKKNNEYKPLPLFDTLDHHVHMYADYENPFTKEVAKKHLVHLYQSIDIILTEEHVFDYFYAHLFLYEYRGSAETFNAYRRELDRFLQWTWFIKNSYLKKIKKNHLEEFIEFCQNPPKNWIGEKVVPRYLMVNTFKIPHPEWKPFVVKVKKADFKNGHTPLKEKFNFSSSALKQTFSIISSFYENLIQMELNTVNPVKQIRQKSKFIVKESFKRPVRRLSRIQWNAVLEACQTLSHDDSRIDERTEFMIHLLFGLYLRISEMTASKRWNPVMSDFYKDSQGNWWFQTVGKGNKKRIIAVSDETLECLKKYRTKRGLDALPVLGENTPLIEKVKGKGALSSTRLVRQHIQICFDKAAEILEHKNESEEAVNLRHATVHWLRHTGISEDVKIRPREHVRDDAGHSSSMTTDRYIDVDLLERAQSAKNKKLTF